MRIFTVTCGTGPSSRTWRLSLPDISALAESLPVLADVSLPTPATVKRGLGMAEPVLLVAAEVAGAGIPELLVVVAAVHVAKHLWSQACPADPNRRPPRLRAPPEPYARPDHVHRHWASPPPLRAVTPTEGAVSFDTVVHNERGRRAHGRVHGK
jgi:hypothetical protein